MSEKLAAAEARALKSEYCLLKLRQYLDDHADVEDRPDTNEVRPNDYMRVLVAMDTMLIDLTAARELMAKAAERDALAAHCERLKGSLQSLHGQCEEHLPGYAYSEQETINEELIDDTPAASLAAYRGEVLSDAARRIREGAMNYSRLHNAREQDECYEIAAQLEQQATEIRAMKEAK